MLRALAILALLLATVSGFAALQPARAEGTPALRPDIAVLADIVTIGDFYIGAGQFASVPLFRSPDIGVTGSVPAEDVARRARAAGLTQAGTDGLTDITVRRPAETFDAGRLKRFTAAALADRDASLTAQDLDISFFREPAPILADPANVEPVRIDQVLWSRNDGRFTITFSVAAGRSRRPVSISGYAREMVEVAVLTQPVGRGTIVKSEDFVLTRLPVQQVPARAVQDSQDLVGLSARINLRPNAPLIRSNFERPVMVGRNERVTVTFTMPGMKLTTRGQAMEDGSEGDLIDVMNLQSRRIVPAIVTSRGQVRIAGAASQIASLEGAAR